MRTLRVILMAIFFLCTLWTSAYAVQGNYIDITEDWDGLTHVDFSVETTYTDIIGFAVGTNFSFNFGAAVDGAASNPAPSDWEGAAAIRHQTQGWKAVEFTGLGFTLSDLPGFINLDLLSQYNSAFVFYSASGTQSLQNFFTNGFSGFVFGEDSTFLAFRMGDPDPIVGETSSPVPVPGSVVLLISGTLGLAGMRRRNR